MKLFMSERKFRSPLLAAAMMAIAVTGGVSADDRDEMIAWDDAPVAVQQAIEAHLPDAVGSSLEREMDRGVVVYEVEFRDEDLEREIEVTEAGEVLNLEVELDPADLPEAVQESLRANFPETEIEEAERILGDFYEVELEVDERSIEVIISSEGEIKSQGTDDDDDHDDHGEHDDHDDHDEDEHDDD